MTRNINLNNFILIFFCLCFTSNVNAEQDSTTLPVEVSVDSYFQLILQSSSIFYDINGKQVSSTKINPGALNFGDLFQINDAQKNLKNKFQKSSSADTHTFIKVVNNSKPFQLSISIIPEKDGFILDLQTLEKNSSALHIQTKKTEKTINNNNIINPEIWTPFPDTGTIIIYDSRGEVISDELEVIFSILNLNSLSRAAKYGGKVIWTLVPTA